MQDIHILGEGDRPVPCDGNRWLLEEDRTYRVVVDRPVDELWLGLRRLDVTQDRSEARLVCVQTSGDQMLEWVWPGGRGRQLIHVIPRLEKLTEQAWDTVLSDLDSWLPGVTVGLEGLELGTVTHSGGIVPGLVSALLPLLPRLLRALDGLLEDPRERDVSIHEELRLHQIRRAQADTLRRLATNPLACASISRWSEAEESPTNVLMPIWLAGTTLDHPANRYVRWALDRIASSLRDASTVLGRQGELSDLDLDTRSWCLVRADACLSAASRIRERVRRSFLRDLEPAPPTEAALLTLADDPLYSRFHRLARRFLTLGFRLQGSTDAMPAPVRPSYTLWELWTFLALGQRLRAVLGGWTWQEHLGNHLLAFCGTATGARIVGLAPNSGRLELSFNETFPSFWASEARSQHGAVPGEEQEPTGFFLSSPQARPFSLSSQRRPDIVMRWDPPGGETGTWMCLDAKYRAGSRNLGDALESAHIYRDALIDPQRGGRPVSCLLLVPSTESACVDWFRTACWDGFGLGAMKLEPGKVEKASGIDWMLERMGVL
jgi:hypothetical protein